jgi:hypothetical protein
MNLKNLYWIEEYLPSDIISEEIHDGIGYFLDGKFVLLLTEDSKTNVYRGVAYPYQLFYGCFFPIVKIKHSKVISMFPFLENHPAKKDWLYIPAENENFEEEVKLVLREISKKNKLFGIEAKEKAAEKRARSGKDISRAKKMTKIKKVKADKKSENALMLSITQRRR